ncbi:MAG: PEGA domain-containing protein [Phycisphaerae bacterium]|nr:PEGA domain-containing protein [Tepidisphaeraceae bacterium]
MRFGTWLAAAVLLVAGSGCATLRGDSQKVKFETDPSGAEVVVDGKDKVTTPGELTLKRRETHNVEVRKDGYKTVQFTLGAEFDGAVLTDLVVPGGSALTGLSVTTGSDKSFNTLQKIKLEKGSGTTELWEHRGVLYTRVAWEAAKKEEAENKDRFMGTGN